MTNALKFGPVQIKAGDGRVVVISPEDVQWIAERMDTAPTGRVFFSKAAVTRFRRLTGQADAPSWWLRAQMLNAFGHLA